MLNKMSQKAFKALLALCLLEPSACAVKRKRLDPTSAQTSPTPQKPNNLSNTQTPNSGFGYFLASDTRPPVVAEKLRVYRPQVARLAFGESFLPLLSFGADGDADYVSWQACSYQGSGRCLGGRSMAASVLLGALAPDTYTISLQACVYPERALLKDKNCGPLSSVQWRQPTSLSPLQDALVQELADKNAQIQALGKSLYDQLGTFAKEVKACKKLGAQDKKTKTAAIDSEAIDTLVTNLLNLGPEFSAATLATVRLNDSDAELAAILDPALIQPSEGQNYKPGGLLLSQTDQQPPSRDIDWQALEAFYAKARTQQLLSSNSISSRNILPALIGSSGLSQAGLALNASEAASYRRFSPEEFTALSPQAKAAAFAGVLAIHAQGLHLSGGSAFAGDFAAGEFLRSALWLKSPTGSCQAYTRLEDKVTALRERAQSMKERILELKAELNAESP